MSEHNSLSKLIASKVKEAQKHTVNGEAAKLKTLTLRVHPDTFADLEQLAQWLGGKALKPSTLGTELLSAAVKDGLKNAQRLMNPEAQSTGPA